MLDCSLCLFQTNDSEEEDEDDDEDDDKLTLSRLKLALKYEQKQVGKGAACDEVCTPSRRISGFQHELSLKDALVHSQQDE